MAAMSTSTEEAMCVDLTADSSDEEAARQAKRQRTQGSPDESDVELVEQAAGGGEPLQEEQLDDDIVVLGGVGEVRPGDRAGCGAPTQP